MTPQLINEQESLQQAQLLGSAICRVIWKQFLFWIVYRVNIHVLIITPVISYITHTHVPRIKCCHNKSLLHAVAQPLQVVDDYTQNKKGGFRQVIPTLLLHPSIYTRTRHGLSVVSGLFCPNY